MARMSTSDGRHFSPRTTSNARTYQCKICGNEFNSGQSLGGHMNVHRKDQMRSVRNGHSSSATPPTGDYYNASDSTYKGVRYRSEQNKWVAEIRPPRSSKTWWLGTYSTPIEAAYAYDVAITYFGSETTLNFDGHPVYDQIPRISPDLPAQDFASQLRKVVKEYGKRAMQSDPRVEEEEEGSSSSESSGAQDQYTSSCSPTYEDQYVASQTNFEQMIDWDDDAFRFPAETADQSFIPDLYDAPFDFDNMHPVPYENYNGAYQPPSHSYEPDTGMYYNQASPGMSSGYNQYNGTYYDQPQHQSWSPNYSYNQYNSY